MNKNFGFFVIMLVMLALGLTHRNTPSAPKTVSAQDSILNLANARKAEATRNLDRRIFALYYDSLVRIGYGHQWAEHKTRVELGYTAPDALYLAIEED